MDLYDIEENICMNFTNNEDKSISLYSPLLTTNRKLIFKEEGKIDGNINIHIIDKSIGKND